MSKHEQLDLYTVPEQGSWAIEVRVPNGSGTTTRVCWPPPHLCREGWLAKRRAIVAEIRKRRRHRHTKQRPGKSPLERGSENLAKPDRSIEQLARRASTTRVRARTTRVRFYYESTGGEMLCFDTDPMSVKQAEALAFSHNCQQGVTGRDKRWAVAWNRTPPCEREARLVFLPSHYVGGPPHNAEVPE